MSACDTGLCGHTSASEPHQIAGIVAKLERTNPSMHLRAMSLNVPTEAALGV